VSGFSDDALADRISDAKARVLITADKFKRGGHDVALKTIVDSALSKPRASGVSTVFVLQRAPDSPTSSMVKGRDFDLHTAMRVSCVVERVRVGVVVDAVMHASMNTW
jgi:acyl-coenzyme A synthetase/AMP-(fatty) acid ligase